MPPRARKNRIRSGYSRRIRRSNAGRERESRGPTVHILRAHEAIPGERSGEVNTIFASAPPTGLNDRASLWNTDEKEFTAVRAEGPAHPSSMKKTFIIGGAIVVLLGGATLYYFLKPVRPDVGLSFSNPGQVRGGEPFSITVSYSNYSNAVLQNAKLSLAAPLGVSFLGMPEGQRVIEQSIGDIGPGSVSQQTFSLVVLGGTETVQRLTATIGYQTANSKAEFRNSADFDVPVGQPALGLTIAAPEKIVSGENFDVTIAYQNNGSEDFKNLHLRVDYPPVFQFVKSDAPPDRGKNYWNIGTLARGEAGKIVISGNAIGNEGSVFKITAQLLGDVLGQTYALGSQEAGVSIATSPLSLGITVNGSVEIIARRGDTLRYNVAYKNNSDTAFQGATIRAAATGNMFDFATAQTNGSFDSIMNIFSWNAGNAPELANIAPGQAGSVSFSVKLKSDFSIRRISDKNYILKVQGTIESPTVPAGTAAQKTVSVAALETKVGGEVALRAAGFSRDAASGILNSGPYPPKVNTPTQYTVHWIITNYATDVSGVKLSAFLQSGAHFTGKTKSTTGSAPAYNPSSGEVSWQIDRIPATKGVLGQPVEAIFQVENTPAVNQVGQNVVLVGETKMAAHDDFADQDLSVVASPVTTDVPDDTTFGQIDRRVQP